MLAGTPAFVGTNPVEILLQHFNRDLPSLGPRCPGVAYGLVALVERMLAKLHDERPSAVEVFAEIERFGSTTGPVKAISSEQITTPIRTRS